MYRQQPVTAARRWPLWLLLVLVMTAWGLWSGGHCADDHPAHADAAVVAFDSPIASAADPVQRNVTGEPADHQQPSAADDDCHVQASPTIAYAPGVPAAIPAVRGHGRISADNRSQPVQPAPPPITLIAIGVSRT
ncbi:hypothetical protein [Paractinoplanes rishiriensis]|uniref:Uncharacterized protein n=1 Tax=Paractinoplanes rishiriensis TaxID=1050105 RepID=A0A919MZN1_9ACTN|nr:hypothetical protein [Actinoplanes rishiriensis]GIF01739.1 hypothetical protein Ari01nite_92030 [Actinoplanes rishiriensis]